MLCEGVELAIPIASSWNANEKGVIFRTRDDLHRVLRCVNAKTVSQAVLLVSYAARLQSERGDDECRRSSPDACVAPWTPSIWLPPAALQKISKAAASRFGHYDWSIAPLC